MEATYDDFERHLGVLSVEGTVEVSGNPERAIELVNIEEWFVKKCRQKKQRIIVLAAGGDDTRHANSTPEGYQPLANSWVELPAIGEPRSGDPLLYPRSHLLNDGDVFISSEIPNYNTNIKVNPYTGAVVTLGSLPDDGSPDTKSYWSYHLPSVLLPLVPRDRYQARILLCGKTPSQLYDFTHQNLGWQTVPRDSQMDNVSRAHACATLLPTGHVLLTGGAHPDDDQRSTGNNPELYHTPLDPVNKAYNPGVGNWETLNDPATLLRNYHSTALLMPDGRVWTAGGNGPNQPEGEATTSQKQIEIYHPPYPQGPRPTISTCPQFVAFGQQFTLGVPSAGNIQNVVLMRCGSSTHAFNPDQRSIWLEFTKATDMLTATAPPNGNIAPPGNYMVFVIDTSGRPCEYAKFIRLGESVSMFNQSQQSILHEVQGLHDTF